MNFIPLIPKMSAEASLVFNKRGDRYSRVTKKDAAKAAVQSAITRSIPGEVIQSLIVEAITDPRDDAMEHLMEKIRFIAAEALREHFDVAPYRPHPEISKTSNHSTYIQALLSPSNNQAVLEKLAKVVPGNLAVDHPASLERLKAQSMKCDDLLHQQMMSGDLPAVLAVAKTGSVHGHDPQELVQTVRNQARCYLVRTAHSKIEMIRLHSTSPFGEGFAGFNTWAKVGSSYMTTIAAPAGVVQQYDTIFNSRELADIPVKSVPGELISRDLLPEGEDGEQFLAEIVLPAFFMLLARPGAVDNNYAANRFEEIRSTIAHAAATIPGDIRAAGLANMDFCELRTGLSAAQACAYVGLQLKKALVHVDVCIEATLLGKPIPACRPVAVNKKDLAFLVSLLRAETLPDKNASTIGQPKFGSGLGLKSKSASDFDKLNGGSVKLVRTMLKAIEDPKINEQASLHFGLDASAWFAG